MKTDIVKINPRRPDIDIIRQAALIIRAGGLVVLPTDTVYGLACDATNIQAVKKVFAAKMRPLTQPLSIALAHTSQISRYVKKYPASARKLVTKFLPGALTLILEKSDVIPNIVTAYQKDIGIRIPDCKIPLMLLEILQRPVVIPSANRHNYPSPVTARAAIKDLTGKVDFVLDAGKTKLGKESTIVSCLGKEVKIIRHGAIPDNEIFRAVAQNKEL